MSTRSLPYGIRVGLLCILYVATAKFGLSLDAVHGFAAAVWPPTGIALAALVLGGYRLWPGIALGAFLINVSVGVPLFVAGGMVLGNVLEAVVGTVLLTRVVRFCPSLNRLRDVMGLVVLAAGLSTVVSATIGVASGWLGGVIPAATAWQAWRTWWLGDALGDLIVAPLLFVWSGCGRLSLSPWRVAEAMAVLVCVSALSLAVFGPLRVPPPLVDFPYILFPALIWAAVRLGPQGGGHGDRARVRHRNLGDRPGGRSLCRTDAPREPPVASGLYEHRSRDYSHLVGPDGRTPGGGGHARAAGGHCRFL